MRWTPALLLPLLLVSLPAMACSIRPLAPGERPPTEIERLRGELDSFDSIVYVEVLRRGTARDRVPVRVLQVLKGALRAGAVVTVGRGFGFDPNPCAGMIVGSPFVFIRGERAVIAFRTDQPEFNRVDQHDLDLMVRERWIPALRVAR